MCKSISARRWIAGVTWLLCSPSFAQTLPPGNLDPVFFDLQGTWVLRGTWVGQSFCAPEDPYVNPTMYGRDHVRFQRTSHESGTDADGIPFLRIHYGGRYVHRAAFYRTNRPPAPYRTVCATEDVSYDVDATLTRYATIRQNGHARPRYEFTATLNANPAPVYEAFRTAVTGDVGTGTPSNLFIDPFGRQMALRTVQRIIAPDYRLPPGYVLANEGVLPPGCDGHYPDTVVGFFSSDSCPGSGVADSIELFVRGDPDLRFVPTGAISAQVTLTDAPGEALASGTGALFRLASPLRERGATELEEDYQAYLSAQLASAQLVGETDVAPDGGLRFDDVEILERTPSSNVATGALYAIAVSGVRRNSASGEVLYRARAVANLGVPTVDQSVELAPIDELSAKLRWTRQLTALGPQQYGPVEMRVRDYLATLTAGAPTPEQLEGVRRAIVAERAIYEGSSYARAFLRELFGAFAEILGPLVADLFSTKDAKLKEAAARAQNLRDARAFEIVQNGFGSLRGRSVEQINDSLRRVMRQNVDLQKRSALKQIKAFLKFAVFDRWSASTQDPADRVLISRLAIAVNGLLDAIVVGSYGGLAGDLTKEAVKALADTFFDNAVAELCFTGRNRGLLEMSRDRMMTWSVDDRDAFVRDLEASNARLQEMFDAAGRAERALIYTKAIAATLGTAKDIFGVADEVSPHARTAAQLSALGQEAATFAALGQAVRMVFSVLPDATARAAYAAYGAAPPAFAELDVPPVPASVTATEEAMEALATFRSGRLMALRAALEDDDIGALLDLYDVDGLPAEWLQVQAAAERSGLAFRALQVPNVEQHGASLQAQAERAWTRGFAAQALEESVLDVVSLALSAAVTSSDPRYLRVREQALDRLDYLASLLDELGDVLTTHQLSLSGGMVLPIVTVSDLGVVSMSTGRSSISSAGEAFEVRAEVRNLAAAPIRVTARLDVDDPEGRYAFDTASTHAVDLAAAGSPGDRQVVIFTGAHDGLGLDGAGVTLRVSLGDASLGDAGGAQPPTTFLDAPASVTLTRAWEELDADHDGVPDSVEPSVGMDPAVSDGAADVDGDGLNNREEYLHGTRIDVADTDGDGLDDAEERSLGADGEVTDPGVADTDGDGIPDGADSFPLDALGRGAAVFPEPVVELSVDTVRLAPNAPLAETTVSNAGAGELRFVAWSDDPRLVVASPPWPRSGQQGEALSLMLAANEVPAEDVTVGVHVMDLTGREHDVRTLSVLVSGAGSTMDAGVGDASMDGGGMSDAAAGDAGIATESSGCACRTAPGTGPGWPGSWLLTAGWTVSFALRRRRRRLRAGG